MEHIGNILGLCKGIFWMANEAKVFRMRCLHLAERIKPLEELVKQIKRKGPRTMSADVDRALWKLSMTLTTAHELVKRCAKTQFVNPLKCNTEFNIVNDGLRDTFHILAGAASGHGGGNHNGGSYQNYTPGEADNWAGGLAFSECAQPSRGAAAPRAQSSAAVYTATVEVDGNLMYVAEELLLTK